MAKKSPYNNPALSFFNTEEDTAPAADPKEATPADKEEAAADPTTMEKPGTPPKGYKVNPMYIEVKSQRVQLVMQPSVVKRAKKAAGKNKISFNELASRAIIEYLEREGF